MVDGINAGGVNAQSIFSEQFYKKVKENTTKAR